MNEPAATPPMLELTLRVPEALHPETVSLVLDFAEALADKLRRSELKHGYSDDWARVPGMDWCRSALVDHVQKGDPVDVAAYCAFLWKRGESTFVARACAQCGTALNQPGRLLTRDCGGDCLACMGAAGDPAAVTAIQVAAKELADAAQGLTLAP